MKDFFALLENHTIHTDWLTKAEANEMLERHSRIFPDIQWDVVPMSEVIGQEKEMGFCERHQQSAQKYFSI